MYKFIILHRYLTLVKVLRLDHLHLVAEALDEIRVDDAVTGREKGQHMLDEVLLGFLEAGPVLQVLGQVDLLSGPEGGHRLLVHAPHVCVFDREQVESVRVLGQEGLWQ